MSTHCAGQNGPLKAQLSGLDEAGVLELGRRLSGMLFSGAFIALFGGLGAGKTTLVRGIGLGLGLKDIPSPTFTIVREHMGRLPLFHFDAYRLADEEELFAMGFMDYAARGGITAMEWCENVPGALPPERLDIAVSGSGTEPRSLELCARGTAHKKLLEALLK